MFLASSQLAGVDIPPSLDLERNLYKFDAYSSWVARQRDRQDNITARMVEFLPAGGTGSDTQDHVD